jgi:hypothetical protein
MKAKTWKQAAKQNRKAYRHWFDMAMYYLTKWRKTEEDLLMVTQQLAKFDCACESGSEYEPEFICGWHQIIYEIVDSKGIK